MIRKYNWRRQDWFAGVTKQTAVREVAPHQVSSCLRCSRCVILVMACKGGEAIRRSQDLNADGVSPFRNSSSPPVYQGLFQQYITTKVVECN